MKKDLAGLIILYYPKYEEVYRNISSYCSCIETLYIIENSNINKDFINSLKELVKIRIISSGKNIGISKSLNLALEHASKDKYEWLLTMDQDTSFERNDFSSFLNSFENINKKNLIIFSPIHNKKFITTNIIEKEFVMTSANIINVEKSLKINGFNDKLFIDEIDHDFCFKSIINKYKIIVNENIAVNHSLGKKDIRNVTIYPALRLYYMCRNYLYIREKYNDINNDFFKLRDKYLIKFFIRHLIYSSEKFKCLKMILLGMFDYKNNKFGKYNEK